MLLGYYQKDLGDINLSLINSMNVLKICFPLPAFEPRNFKSPVTTQPPNLRKTNKTCFWTTFSETTFRNKFSGHLKCFRFSKPIFRFELWPKFFGIISENEKIVANKCLLCLSIYSLFWRDRVPENLGENRVRWTERKSRSERIELFGSRVFSGKKKIHPLLMNEYFWVTQICCKLTDKDCSGRAGGEWVRIPGSSNSVNKWPISLRGWSKLSEGTNRVRIPFQMKIRAWNFEPY